MKLFWTIAIAFFILALTFFIYSLPPRIPPCSTEIKKYEADKYTPETEYRVISCDRSR